MTTTALVIVHLSSIDSYAENISHTAGTRLARAIIDAVHAHQGPVYVIDQGWDGPLVERVAAAIDDAPVTWIAFDEDVDDWNKFLPKLKRQLTRDHIERVVVGGIWYDPTLKDGCATRVYMYLRRTLPTKVDESIVGCFTDETGRTLGDEISKAISSTTLARAHRGWVHVTHPDLVPRIRQHGLLVAPPGRQYSDGDFATLGGIYVGHMHRFDDLRDRFCNLFDGSWANDAVPQIAVLHLTLPAGTQFCLDEDEIDEFGLHNKIELSERYWEAFREVTGLLRPGGSGLHEPKAVGKLLTEAYRKCFPSGKRNRAALDRWSCRLAQMLDQEHLDQFYLRLFTPPIIERVEMVDC